MPDCRAFQARVAPHGDSIVLCFNAKDPNLEDETGSIVWNYCAFSWMFMEHRRPARFSDFSEPPPMQRELGAGSAADDTADMMDLKDLTWPEVPGSGIIGARLADPDANLETASLDGMRGDGDGDGDLDVDIAGM